MKSFYCISSLNVSYSSVFWRFFNTSPLAHAHALSFKSKKPKIESRVSTAMLQYMKRKEEYDLFMEKERHEFEMGKEHLSNMMGIPINEINQSTIDDAISYLFPCGLPHKPARPSMRSPDEIYPTHEKAQFDSQGRPFSSFFYTRASNFFSTMFEVGEMFEELLIKESECSNQKVDEVLVEKFDFNVLNTKWLPIDDMSKIVGQNITEDRYNILLQSLDRLVESRVAYQFRDQIFKYRTEPPHVAPTEDGEANIVQHERAEVLEDENGRKYTEALGLRKTACAKAKVFYPGSGSIIVQHIDFLDHPKDIRYFSNFKDRNQILFPLQFTNMLNKVDIELIVDSGGSSTQAGASRFAISKALTGFVDNDYIGEMRAVGLITQDIRTQERNRPGCYGARRRRFWRKR